jgi:predicted N-acyltransferase
MADLDPTVGALGDVDAATWDALAHPSLYLSHAWLRARSRTIKGEQRFVLVSAPDGEPLLGAPGYLVGGSSHPGYDPARVLQVDDLPDEEVAHEPGGARALDLLRATLRERGGELHPSLVMAAPGRSGGVGYGAELDPDERAAALRVALDALDRQAVADGARSICWLYVMSGEDDVLPAVLREHGYLGVVVDAECYLPVAWDSFDGYLAAFNSQRRKKIRHEMRALSSAGAVVEEHGADALGPRLATLELQWRAKYGRTPALDDVLADYEELRTHFAKGLRVFVASLDGRPIGFTTFLEQGDVWYSRFGGFDYSAGNLFLYFNLLFYHPVRAAIDHGVRCVRYSLKSYRAKHSRGCSLRNVLAYVRLPQEIGEQLRGPLDLVDRTQRRRFAEIDGSPVLRTRT